MRTQGEPSSDAVVIGAGFYGCEIALELKRLGFRRVVLAERERRIMRRASFVNQARVHRGYHYPRSLTTAERSRINYAEFVTEYRHAVRFETESIYAIARGSRVSAAQFETFCRAIEAPCQPAPRRIAALFDRSLIEEVFITRELTFNAAHIAAKLEAELADAGIDVRFGTEAHIVGADDTGVEVAIGDVIERASFVFNCTYSGIEFAGVPLKTRVKKELTEILLIEPPRDLSGLCVTIMDGPFFSTMPFPAADLYSLYHVRYAPHEASIAGAPDALRPTRSNGSAMMRDARRYLPCIGHARVNRSLFEVRAILDRNEDDDGRPILIERAEETPRIFSILGSKLDNIYDVKKFLRARSWGSA